MPLILATVLLVFSCICFYICCLRTSKREKVELRSKKVDSITCIDETLEMSVAPTYSNMGSPDDALLAKTLSIGMFPHLIFICNNQNVLNGLVERDNVIQKILVKHVRRLIS